MEMNDPKRVKATNRKVNQCTTVIDFGATKNNFGREDCKSFVSFK